MFLRLIFIFIIICFVVIGGWFFIQQKQNQCNISTSVTDSFIQSEHSLKINNIKINVEVVDTDEKRKKGLSGRSGLAENQGMLFVFDQSRFYPFWMKEMLFSIDVVWINSDEEVVFIKKDVQPCIDEDCQLITPDKKAKYVLEIKAGIADKINIKIGDKLIFDR